MASTAVSSTKVAVADSGVCVLNDEPLICGQKLCILSRCNYSIHD
jgi:hypothetical protein